MCLFDDTRQPNDRPGGYAEPGFTFLNRSSRIDVSRIREVLKDWYSRYPIEHASDLRARFQDTNNHNHRSAFFELFLHELLLRFDCEVTVHPDTPNLASTHPDFLARDPSGKSFYLEAVVVNGDSAEQEAENQRMNRVYDTLNRMHSPNFFLHMRIRGAPATTSPKGRKLRHYLERELAKLDPDEIKNLREAYGSSPAFHYREDGWEIDFFPVPKSPSLRGRPDVRPIGSQMRMPRWIDSITPIRSALLAKARRYGKLDRPLVVALNALDDFVDDLDFQQALIGTEQWFINIEEESKMVRAADGVFVNEYGSRLSAVLLIKHLHPWSITDRWILLVHNQLATWPYDSVLTCFPQAGSGGRKGGETIETILNLPQEWPRGEDGLSA